MTDTLPKPLTSVEWLKAHIGEPDIRIIDGSWRMPGEGDAQADYKERHIPGAVFFSINEVADTTTPLPHMFPAPETFERAVGSMGISDADRVVVYDDQGLFSAARVWWTFRAMGHKEVAVLDGGLPRWIAAGGATTGEATKTTPASYRAVPRPEMIADAGAVRAALSDPRSRVLDARPAGRFAGVEPEPRPGLRRGRMPGAANVPASALLSPDGTLRPVEDLRTIFAEAGLTPDMAAVTTCGSGITAAILTLALVALGRDRHALYDGSWVEWGDERNDPGAFPVEAGA